MSTLHLHDLSIGYGKSLIQEHLNLSARSGEMVCLLGQNGCGKSTLIRTIAGLQPALGGSFTLDTEEKAAVVLTDRLSVDHATVHDIVAMGRYPYSSWLGVLTEEDKRIVREAIANMELTHKTEAFFNELSDGEKQRALIAKAIAQQTSLIILDEPTAHLDLPNRIKTLLTMRELAHQTGRIVLISTHELDLALQTADTIWLMTPRKANEKAGGVVVGTPEELIASGEFQSAFADDHFTFKPNGRSLQIVIK